MNNLFFVMFPFFVFLGFFLLFLCFFLANLNLNLYIQWDMYVNSSKMSFPVYMDVMSCLFMSLVLLISGSIIFYSEFYMESEIYKMRFFYLMMFFVISMIFLILCPNMIFMLIGWDGLGLVSYCLVIFYQNYKSFSAGMITVLTNRIGDVFILGSIGLLFCFGDWNYLNILKFPNMNLIMIFFMIAAMTKSAQIPFSAWLPAAMAAPTPVSSLVHSSTLVTAGVYILIRFSFFFTPFTKNFLLLMALLTMIMSGICGVFEYDLKKIIALSTLSQLGFMMSTLSLGMIDLTFFHLITHACFKALLFMCAGFLIHLFLENQDIRGFGLMNSNCSLVMCFFNVANLSLCGFPFLSGFFSKDLILEMILMNENNLIIFFLFMIGTSLTVIYSFRLFFFLTFKHLFFFSSLQLNNKAMGIQNSMFILFFFSITLGYYMTKYFFLPYNFIILPFMLKLLISLICLLSFWISCLICHFTQLLNMKKKYILFFSSMWFLTFLKTDFMKFNFLNIGYMTNKLMYGWIENFFGLKNLSNLFFLSKEVNKICVNSFFYMFCCFFIYIMFFLMLL